MNLQKMTTYISTHYHGLMNFQIPTHLYKHCMMIKKIRQNMINYLNDIITQGINQYKSCPITRNTNYIDNNLDNIHTYTTKTLDFEQKTFAKLFQTDIHKLMNICN